jgi:hypothetical protein
MKLLDIILEDETILDGVQYSHKTDQEWFDYFKIKFPNWDYSNAEIYKGNDGIKKIKNIYCKIHKHNFPEGNSSELVITSHNLQGVGCRDCGIEKNKKTYTPEEITQELIASPFTKNLKFDNVEYEGLDGQKFKIKIKNYSCKIHPTWFKETPTIFKRVKYGESNCAMCHDDKSREVNKLRIKTDEQSKDDLEKSTKTIGLNFDNVEFKREQSPFENNTYITRLLIKNYSCKIHKWWKQNEWTRHDGVIGGLSGCKICGILSDDKKKGKIIDNWDGKFDDDVNSQYNKWIIKRNNLLKSNWLKISKKEHFDPKTKKPKYGYDKVNFNDPNSIKYYYKPSTKEYYKIREFEIFCPKSNHGYFLQDAKIHKKGSGCPLCRESKGEIYLANLFSNNDIKYVRGKDARFEGLVGKKIGLTCDFYLPERKVIIEYDGKQHFEPIFGSTEGTRMKIYTMTYTNDNVRDRFAKTNKEGISLIRIPYTIEFSDINVQLFAALRKIGPNEVIRLPLGSYPSRKKPKTILHKDQVDLSQPIQKPNRTGPKLSLMNTLKNI